MANHRAPVPVWLTSSYMEDVMKKTFGDEKLEIRSMDLGPGSNAGDNYACQIFRIKLTYNTKGQEEKLSIIAKFQPDTKLLESLKESDFFGVESKFFMTLAPMLREIEVKVNEYLPKCYLVDVEKTIIFLEDLTVKSFQLQPGRKFLNRTQCELLMEALATLHGASYYALEKDPSLKQTFRKYFWSSERNEPTEKMFKNAQNVFERLAETYGLSDGYSKKLRGLMEKLEINWCKVCDFQDGHLNFLLHGDSWMNNMMFHFKDGAADAVKLLDFQLINYNCFANDLQYFLFSSASAEVLLNDLEGLLYVYYKTLRTIAPQIPDLTFDRIKTEFAERYYFGYLMFVVFRACLISEEPPELDDLLNGKEVEVGYNDPRYISDLKLLLPFFERIGVF